MTFPDFGRGTVTESTQEPAQSFQTDSLEFGSDKVPKEPHATFPSDESRDTVCIDSDDCRDGVSEPCDVPCAELRVAHFAVSCTSTKRSASGHGNARTSLDSNRTKSDSARKSSRRISTYSPSLSETDFGSGKNFTNTGHECVTEKSAKPKHAKAGTKQPYFFTAPSPGAPLQA